jgi:hypothetical protein
MTDWAGHALFGHLREASGYICVLALQCDATATKQTIICTRQKYTWCFTLGHLLHIFIA